MFGKEHLFIKKSIKNIKFYILEILMKIRIVWERSLLIIKGIKKTIFDILKILIKIGNVCDRIFIYHLKYKKKQYFIS